MMSFLVRVSVSAVSSSSVSSNINVVHGDRRMLLRMRRGLLRGLAAGLRLLGNFCAAEAAVGACAAIAASYLRV